MSGFGAGWSGHRRGMEAATKAVNFGLVLVRFIFSFSLIFAWIFLWFCWEENQMGLENFGGFSW
jgi:hypothetical protein